jgi:hypothetical protein
VTNQTFLARIARLLFVTSAMVNTGCFAEQELRFLSAPRFTGEGAPARVTGPLTTSDRWSGYALIDGVYTSMQGSWNVPTISYAHGCPPSALVRQIGWVEEGRISGSS